MQVLLECAINRVIAAVRHRVLLRAEAASTLTNGLERVVAHAIRSCIPTGCRLRLLDDCRGLNSRTGRSGLDAVVSCRCLVTHIGSGTKGTHLSLVVVLGKLLRHFHGRACSRWRAVAFSTTASGRDGARFL